MVGAGQTVDVSHHHHAPRRGTIWPSLRTVKPCASCAAAPTPRCRMAQPRITVLCTPAIWPAPSILSGMAINLLHLYQTGGPASHLLAPPGHLWSLETLVRWYGRAPGRAGHGLALLFLSRARFLSRRRQSVPRRSRRCLSGTLRPGDGRAFFRPSRRAYGPPGSRGARTRPTGPRRDARAGRGTRWAWPTWLTGCGARERRRPTRRISSAACAGCTSIPTAALCCTATRAGRPAWLGETGRWFCP